MRLQAHEPTRLLPHGILLLMLGVLTMSLPRIAVRSDALRGWPGGGFSREERPAPQPTTLRGGSQTKVQGIPKEARLLKEKFPKEAGTNRMTKFGLNRDQPVSVVQEEWRPMAKPWTVRVPVVERESLSNPVSISNVDATDLAPESTGFMQSLQDKILREEKPLLMEEAQESPRAGSAVLPRDKPTAKDPASSKPVAYAFRYQPSYPYIARKLGWEGAVRLRVLVRDDGLVDRLEVVSSSGYDVLDSSALEAVRTWRFEPAREGSHPVRAWIVVPVHFRLEEPSHTG